MIVLTRLDGKELVVNADHILTVEATPDTVLLLTTGHTFMVAESVDEVMERAAAWQRRVRQGPSPVHSNVLSFPHRLPQE
ncbi:MAG TPA: flagellar FlbD family protein [Anaeromyxobacteraceae bacterium]|nr:flagellar FlbD family protein [Anaeromyxobacteraceae bacterium]